MTVSVSTSEHRSGGMAAHQLHGSCPQRVCGHRVARRSVPGAAMNTVDRCRAERTEGEHIPVDEGGGPGR